MTVSALLRVRPRGLLIAGCTVIALLGLPASAAAHAVLVTSQPGWGAVLRTEPGQLRLEYDEDVVPQYARVDVVAPGGQVLSGPPHVAGNVVVVALRPGNTGSYTVRWKMVASTDGHVTEGAFSFGVRATPLPPAPASGVSVPVAPQLLAWLQFLGVVLAGGALTFRALVLAPAAWGVEPPPSPATRAVVPAVDRDSSAPRGLDRESSAARGLDRESSAAIWIGVVGAVLALHAGLFGFLVGAYPIVGGGILNVINTQIIPIRVGTHLGQAWTLMTFAWLGVLALLVGAWVTPRRREQLLAGAGVLSLAIAFGISWASHPASRGTLPLAADYVHLLAGALWVGGLVALASLAWAARALPRSSREDLFRACLVRFSKLAAPVVVALALAGAYMALRELPGPSALLNSNYGITLLAKTIVFMGALGLGAYHRRFVVPRIAAGGPVAGVRRTLVLEAGLLIVAVALAAILSQAAPPR